MASSSLLSQLNIAKTCRALGLPLWQCPNFLFLIMGVLIIISTLSSYAIGTRLIGNPAVVALLTLILAAILLAIAFIITNSFDRLAEASRLKTEFVNIVSHQLRSPLSNLQWGLEVLLSEKMLPKDERQTEYLHILKENSDRMQELVNDLLVVSRIQEGSLLVEKKTFSFAELLNTILAEFNPWIRASHIVVKVEGQDPLPQITSDSLFLRQAVQNLIENAIRYGGGLITIRFSCKNSQLHFEVEDNGIGIPPADQKHIFQKFFRSSNASQRETYGSGLGLYIAKSMIEKVGGKIGFTSVENKRSIFWFTIPTT